MTKIKNLFVVFVFSVLVYSCEDTTALAQVDNFDHAAQAKIDSDSLVKFFENHYYDVVSDEVKALVSGKTALFEDAKLKSMDVKEDEIDYKLYYYVNAEGSPKIDLGFPTVMDSVFVKYHGQRIINTKSLSAPFDSSTNVWFRLHSVVRGWTYGFTKFKGGNLKKDPVTGGALNGPITYENSGKGILFIPSGLAYRNTGDGAILANENLIFYFNLHTFIKDTDYDNDGVPSIFEDPDGDGDPRNDDTDGNNLPNYADPDDDGDGVLTIDEDTNKDGDPRNDDTDKDGIPNYLDSDS